MEVRVGKYPRLIKSTEIEMTTQVSIEDWMFRERGCDRHTRIYIIDIILNLTKEQTYPKTALYGTYIIYVL